jgi:aspartate carbamoyltransferase catalytic subunit
MPLDVMNEVKAHDRPVDETYDVHDIIADVDVLYITRVQRERFADQAQYDSVKEYYIITPELMALAKEQMVVMHPLPRVSEISYAIDDDPRAAYFRQMENGMYIRMALLAAVLGKA